MRKTNDACFIKKSASEKATSGFARVLHERAAGKYANIQAGKKGVALGGTNVKMSRTSPMGSLVNSKIAGDFAKLPGKPE